MSDGYPYPNNSQQWSMTLDESAVYRSQSRGVGAESWTSLPSPRAFDPYQPTPARPPLPFEIERNTQSTVFGDVLNPDFFKERPVPMSNYQAPNAFLQSRPSDRFQHTSKPYVKTPIAPPKPPISQLDPNAFYRKVGVSSGPAAFEVGVASSSTTRSPSASVSYQGPSNFDSNTSEGFYSFPVPRNHIPVANGLLQQNQLPGTLSLSSEYPYTASYRRGEPYFYSLF